MKKMLCALLLVTAGCGANGVPFDASQVPANRSTLVLYRPDHTLMGGRDYSIKVNDKVVCSLENAGYTIVPVENGETTIKASTWDTFGSSKLALTINQPTAYYVKVEPAGNVVDPIFLGAAGTNFSATLTQTQATDAMPALTQLKHSANCP